MRGEGKPEVVLVTYYIRISGYAEEASLRHRHRKMSASAKSNKLSVGSGH